MFHTFYIWIYSFHGWKSMSLSFENDKKLRIQISNLRNPTIKSFVALVLWNERHHNFFQGSSDTKLLCSTLSIHLRSDHNSDFYGYLIHNSYVENINSKYDWFNVWKVEEFYYHKIVLPIYIIIYSIFLKQKLKCTLSIRYVK